MKINIGILKFSLIILLFCSFSAKILSKQDFLNVESFFSLDSRRILKTLASRTAQFEGFGSKRGTNPLYQDDYHIIDEHTIRKYLDDTLKELYKDNKDTERALFINRMNFYIDNNEEVITAMEGFQDDLINQIDELFRSITWNKGNLVPGPHDRSDDAHGGFDDKIFEVLPAEQKALIKKALDQLKSKSLDFFKTLKVLQKFRFTEIDWTPTKTKGRYAVLDKSKIRRKKKY